MDPWIQTMITIVCTAIASSGFWAFLQRRSEKKDVKTQMLMGIAHDKILSLGLTYVERGFITRDEYENLHDCLFGPYEKMGGNGSVKRIMQEVNRLPIRSGLLHNKENKDDE
jgi:hypothetical protein